MTNLFQRRLSCHIHPGIQLQNTLSRPHAHDWDIWDCVWYFMKIEENELDNERWGSRAILTKKQWNDLHAANCQPRALECNRTMQFLTQIPWIAVDQKLRGNRTPGCKQQYIQTQYWMSILCIWLVAYNHWVYKGCFDVINVSVNRVSKIVSLTHSAIKRPHCHILAKWMYWLLLYGKRQITSSLPYPKIECQRNVNGASTIFGIVSWRIQIAGRWHLLIIELSATFLGKHGYSKIATMS